MDGINDDIKLWHFGAFCDEEMDQATSWFRYERLIFSRIDAANAYAAELLNIVETKSHTEVSDYLERHPPSSSQITFIIRAAKNAQKKQQSKKATTKRHAASNAARMFIKGEWELHKAEYAGNKSEFVRTYISIVANRFKNANGDPLKITEKQMREVWLADTPSAGKQAG